MKANSIGILLAVTAGVIAVTTWKLSSNQAATKPAARGTAPLFAGLRDKVNEVAFVQVTTPDGSYALEKKGDSWGAVQKGGYPVDVNKVKALVVGLATLTVLEEKTKNPSLFAKLELDDPTSPGGKGRQITLKDKNQAVLADLIVGKMGEGRSFTGDPSLFVRKVGGPGAVEVAGNLTVEPNVTGLLDKQIAKVEKKRVRKVETLHPDGEKLIVERATAEQENFDVQGMPEGKELSWPGVASSIGGALEWMNFDDVKPAAEVDLSGQPQTITRFESFDGLVVTCTTVQKDDKVYLKLSSSFEESARQPDAVGPLPPPPAEGAEGAEDKPLAAETPTTTLKSVDEVKADAEKLNQRTANWVYEVPGYGAANLRKKLQDLLKQPTPEGEAEGGLEAAIRGESEIPVVPTPETDSGSGDLVPPSGENKPVEPEPK